MHTPIKNITVIGSGNVATHMATAIYSTGYTLLEVYSATFENAKKLAEKVNAKAVDTIGDLSPDADLYLFSVSDKSYTEILEAFPFSNKKIAHTAGSLSMQILSGKSPDFGVIYPFQTLSKQKEINFKKVPILVCGSNKTMEGLLKTVAERISNKVDFATDEQRKFLHISAVFACNFTNLMYSLAKSLTDAHNLDFSLLYPLIIETAEKVKTANPMDVQTGPAVRNDQNILSSHMELLRNNPDLAQIYQLLSNTIVKNHHNNGAKEL